MKDQVKDEVQKLTDTLGMDLSFSAVYDSEDRDSILFMLDGIDYEDIEQTAIDEVVQFQGHFLQRTGYLFYWLDRDQELDGFIIYSDELERADFITYHTDYPIIAHEKQFAITLFDPIEYFMKPNTAILVTALLQL